MNGNKRSRLCLLYKKQNKLKYRKGDLKMTEVIAKNVKDLPDLTEGRTYISTNDKGHRVEIENDKGVAFWLTEAHFTRKDNPVKESLEAGFKEMMEIRKKSRKKKKVEEIKVEVEEVVQDEQNTENVE